MPKRVAVIDDDQTLRSVIGETLEQEGYAVTLLSSAHDAATVLRTVAPDLIFLDVHMEQRDIGWSLLSLLWLEPDFAALPVIVSSGDGADLARHRAAIEAQRSVILEKPFDLDDLIAIVNRLIGPAAGMTN